MATGPGSGSGAYLFFPDSEEDVTRADDEPKAEEKEKEITDLHRRLDEALRAGHGKIERATVKALTLGNHIRKRPGSVREMKAALGSGEHADSRPKLDE